MIDVGIFKQPLNALLLGIGDEHLPEVVVAHQSDKLHHPLIVKFIEDIVKQQNGFITDLLIVVFKLCKTDRNHKRLLLTLRAKFLQWMAVKAKFKVVLVNADVGVTRIGVLLKIIF